MSDAARNELNSRRTYIAKADARRELIKLIPMVAPVLAGMILVLAGIFFAVLAYSDPTITVTCILLGASLLIVPLNRRLSGVFDREVRLNRARAEESVARPIDAPPDDKEPTFTVRGDNARVWNFSDSREASEALQKQEEILRDIYTQGLAQAKLSFRVSTFFASVGAGFLLLGVILSIINASSNGSQYASIVSGSAGVVINVTSSLFFTQSNKTRRNMAEQGRLLREESQEDRRLTSARQLTLSIESEVLRDSTLSKIALGLLSPHKPSTDVGDGGAPSDEEVGAPSRQSDFEGTKSASASEGDRAKKPADGPTASQS